MTGILRFFILFIVAMIWVSCEMNVDPGQAGPPIKKDSKQAHKVLNSVLEKKKLRAVTNYGSLSYFIYRGEPMGYQFELLKNLCANLNVELELVIERDLNKCIEMLNDRDVDLIAMGLTITNSRKKNILFTDPIMITRQVLVQRKPKGWERMATADEIESHLLKSTFDLDGKKIYVEEGTVFKQQLEQLANDVAENIQIVTDPREVEELISAVADGEIDYTIADEHVALVNAKYYPNLDVSLAVSFPQKIGWAVKKNQTALADTIDSWLDKFNHELLSRLLINKYFKNIGSRRISKSQYNSYTGGHLSPYDSLIRQGAALLGWDWRFLASLIYQESEFKPEVKSWAGAFGLMQLMPSVLETYGIDSTASPALQIDAGAKYLASLQRQLPTSITDSLQRVLFTVAAYNSGLGHVLDARRLAGKQGLNPDVWVDNTEICMLKLSDPDHYSDPIVYYGYSRGNETYAFVREIYERYSHYVNLIGNTQFKNQDR
ncbi:MAG: transporter substrate-binding domain-containing protein [Bacteroidales bacterium]|nr:transporter substrate-binding domain-containing protein [Bacteroidales bacterium]